MKIAINWRLPRCGTRRMTHIFFLLVQFDANAWGCIHFVFLLYKCIHMIYICISHKQVRERTNEPEPVAQMRKRRDTRAGCKMNRICVWVRACGAKPAPGGFEDDSKPGEFMVITCFARIPGAPALWCIPFFLWCASTLFIFHKNMQKRTKY